MTNGTGNGFAMSPGRSLPELAHLLAPTFPGCDDAPLARDLLRMLARGGPVAPARLAAAAGREESEVRATLRRWPNVHRDNRDRVVAFGGLSLRPTAHREYEGLGLIYSAGRSEGNYRLFDASALWCARTIIELRAIGLTIKEIKQIGDVYLAQPDEPIGPRIAAALDRAEHRAVDQLEELAVLLERIRCYRRDNADALAGHPGADFGARDPRRERRIA